MKYKAVILFTKMLTALLRLAGRGGSVPGRLALRLAPGILGALKYPSEIVLVSGTNGKTTTTNMVFEMLQKKYGTVICNFRGNNQMSGMATLFLNHSTLGGKVKADCAVLEVDELNVPLVLDVIPVNNALIGNFFRDQLDRAGEMETVVARVAEGFGDYKHNLILNADDPNVVRLADAAPKAQIYYYGVDRNPLSKPESREASEGKFCPRCNTQIEYEYYQYSHIGKFKCPNCGFGDHDRYVLAADVDAERRRFRVGGVEFRAPQDALYAIYNCAGAIALGALYSVSLDTMRDVLAGFNLEDGRMETFDIGRPCLLNLVKNPTGANEVMKYIMRDSEAKDILVVLNDNIQDGTDVSWIWDAHFNLLVDENTKEMVFSGKRAYDMALRIKYEGYKGGITVLPNLEDAARKLQGLSDHAYVIATYTALQPMRAVLKKM